MIALWESAPLSEVEVFELFEKIDMRLLDEELWTYHGLSDSDEIPTTPDRVLEIRFLASER